MQKEKYCKKCGARVDTKTKVCTGCGKKYVKAAHVWNVFFCTIIIVLIVLYSKSLSDIEFCNARISNLLDSANGYSNTISKLKNEISEKEDVISDLKEKLEAAQKTSNNKSVYAVFSNPTQSITASSATSDDDNTCIMPGCKMIPSRNSFYCSSHKCLNINCSEKREGYSLYCKWHQN